MKLMTLASSVCLSLALLSACSSTHSPDAASAIAHKDERILGYFSEDGEYGREKIANGYERKLLGTTRNQHWVLQDFYSKTGKPQTSAFKVFDERGLYDWDTLKFTDGLVVFYFADGKKMSQLTMKHGTPSGTREMYYRSGEVFQIQRFNDNGDVVEDVFLRPNGQRMFVVNYDVLNAEKASVLVYDETGKEHFPTADNFELVKTTAEEVQHTLDALENLQYELAGQVQPAARRALLQPFE